jgi:hypothetical protein
MEYHPTKAQSTRKAESTSSICLSSFWSDMVSLLPSTHPSGALKKHYRPPLQVIRIAQCLIQHVFNGFPSKELTLENHYMGREPIVINLNDCMQWLLAKG